MAKYKVKITETYTREVIVDVDNDNENEAEDIAYKLVDEQVAEGEIDLPCDGGDYGYERELFVSKVKEEQTEE